MFSPWVELTLAGVRILVERTVVLLCFDVDSSGIARTAAAQLIAYWSGIVFLVEELLPLVIGRPPAVATVIPAGDPRIGSGSKCNAIGHCALPSPQKGAVAFHANSNAGPSTSSRLGQKKTHVRDFGSSFLPSFAACAVGMVSRQAGDAGGRLHPLELSLESVRQGICRACAACRKVPAEPVVSPCD
jgi:hypothetical protein